MVQKTVAVRTFDDLHTHLLSSADEPMPVSERSARVLSCANDRIASIDEFE